MAELTVCSLFSTKHHQSCIVLCCAIAWPEAQLCLATRLSDNDLIAAFDGKVHR